MICCIDCIIWSSLRLVASISIGLGRSSAAGLRVVRVLAGHRSDLRARGGRLFERCGLLRRALRERLAGGRDLETAPVTCVELSEMD